MYRLVASLLVLASFGCGGDAPEPESSREWVEYSMEGEVLELKEGDPPVAVIDHGEIGDWMGAMTMGFPVRDPEEFAKLSEGAKIRAAVMARGHAEYYLDQIEVVEAPTSEEEAPDDDANE